MTCFTLVTRFAVSLVASSALFFSGCSLFRAPSAPSIRSYVNASPVEETQFRELFLKKDLEIQSARGRYEVTLSKSIHEERVSQVFVFQRPSALRVELFATALNQLVLMLVAREDFIEALDPKEAVLYRGLSTPGTVYRLLGVPLLPEELALWLVGRVYVPNIGDSRILKNEEDGLFALEARVSFGRMLRARFQTDLKERLQLVSVELGSEKNGETYFFSEFVYDESITPKKIHFVIPEQGITGDLERQSITLNPANLPAKLFEIPQAEGVVIEPLGYQD